MALRPGDVAPDFTAGSTEGRIKLHEWAGNSSATQASRPRDFTPVCATALGYVSRLEPDFERRTVKGPGHRERKVANVRLPLTPSPDR